MKHYELIELNTETMNDSTNNSLKIPKIKNIPKFYKTKEFYLKELICFIPALVSIYIYILTLEGCEESQFECIQKVTPSLIKHMLNLLLINSFLININLFLCLFKKCSKIQSLIMIMIYIYLCIFYDNGAYFDKHGGYNRVVLMFLVVIWFLIFCFMILLWHSFKKFPISTIIMIILLLYIINQIIQQISKNSCNDWENGLKGVSIDNSEGCKLNKPKICYYKIFHGYLDFTKLMRENCNTIPTNKLENNIEHMEDKNMKIIGYPRIESWPYYPDSERNKIQKYVMKNLINMEKADENIKKNIETTTNFYTEPPKVTIDLKRRDELAAERSKLYKLNENKVLSKNILYVFIDSLSRANFKTKLPKVYKWIEDKYNIDSDYINSKYESFQFLKFHGLGTYTGINMMPALFGLFNNESNSNHFIKYYKDNGYITGQALNYCGREVFDLDNGAIRNLDWPGWDHELSSFFCDGNFTPYNDLYAILVGLNSIRIRCLYNKSTTSYNLEYANQFFKKYKDDAKFFRLGFYEAHEGTYEVIKYSDEELFNFFDQFEKDGHLEDTIVFFHSDHGLGMAGPFTAMQFEDHVKELVLPSLFMIIPTNIKNYEIIRKNLKHNEQSFGTHFTVFNTLHAILNGWNDKLNDNHYSRHEKYDFIYQQIPKGRNCTEFQKMNYYNNNFICSCD